MATLFSLLGAWSATAPLSARLAVAVLDVSRRAACDRLADVASYRFSCAVAAPLSEDDWQELTRLIEQAPPRRLQVAMDRVGRHAGSPASTRAARLVTGFSCFLHLARRSSGSAFDRALLNELRRLSIH